MKVALVTLAALSIHVNARLGTPQVPEQALQARGAVNDVQCQADEFSLTKVVQRGCRVVDHTNNAMCCGQCGRAVCKTDKCLGCEDQFQPLDIGNDFDSSSNLVITVPDQPAWSVDSADANGIFKTTSTTLALLAVAEAQPEVGILVGAAVSMFEDAIFPQTTDKSIALVSNMIQLSWIKEAAGAITGPADGILFWLKQYFSAKAIDDKITYLNQISLKAGKSVDDILQQVTSTDNQMKAIKIYAALVSYKLYALKLMYNLRDQIAQANATQVNISKRDDVQNQLEAEFAVILKQTKTFSSQYVDWYVKRSVSYSESIVGPYCYTTVAFDDGKFHESADGGSCMVNKAHVLRYVNSQATARAIRDLSPLFLLPKFLDKGLPAVPPPGAAQQSFTNGPYHPYLFSTSDSCCTSEYPWKVFTAGKLHNDVSEISANLNADIDGLYLNNQGSGKCKSLGSSGCQSSSVPQEWMQSAYVYTTSSYQVGLELHFESGEIDMDGRDLHATTQRWVVMSPLAGLEADNYVITSLRSESTTAKMLEFNYDWVGKCFPSWGSLSDLKLPLQQTTKDAISDWYGDKFGPKKTNGWYNSACM